MPSETQSTAILFGKGDREALTLFNEDRIAPRTTEADFGSWCECERELLSFDRNTPLEDYPLAARREILHRTAGF